MHSAGSTIIKEGKYGRTVNYDKQRQGGRWLEIDMTILCDLYCCHFLLSSGALGSPDLLLSYSTTTLP